MSKTARRARKRANRAAAIDAEYARFELRYGNAQEVVLVRCDRCGLEQTSVGITTEPTFVLPCVVCGCETGTFIDSLENQGNQEFQGNRESTDFTAP